MSDPKTSLSGAGGVNIVRENCTREAWARVSFSAQNQKVGSMPAFFDFIVNRLEGATPKLPFQGLRV